MDDGAAQVSLVVVYDVVAYACGEQRPALRGDVRIRQRCRTW